MLYLVVTGIAMWPLSCNGFNKQMATGLLDVLEKNNIERNVENGNTVADA